MHDTTEGGTLGCVFEMSLASGLGFELVEDSIPVDQSTNAVCKALSVDPLRLLGSGSLVISCGEKDRENVIKAVEKEGVKCTLIGKFLPKKKGRKLLRAHGNKSEQIDDYVQDEIWTSLRKYGNLSRN